MNESPTAHRVIIVDSGMRNLGGHNFSYTHTVERALRSRGIESLVLTHKMLPEEIAKPHGYRPTFTFGAYDFPKGAGWWRDLRSIYAQGTHFAAELEAALGHNVAAGDVVFSHTLSDFELIGWNRFVQCNDFRGNLVLLLRITQGFRTVNRAKLIAHPYWRIKPHSLEAIRRRLGDRFLLATDSEELSRDYAAIYSHPIVTLPIPLHEDLLVDGPPHGGGRIAQRFKPLEGDALRIGYLGDARRQKGFFLLPALIRNTLAAAGNVHFVVQCPRAASGSADTEADVTAELRRLEKESDGRLVLVDEHLSEEDYAGLLRTLDVVLIPYLREPYVAATSGIFAEALALAKPVIVPRGTWMSRELAGSSAGLQFESEDAADLAAQLMHLITHADRYRRGAQAFSERWRAFHNADNLVTILLDRLGLNGRGGTVATESLASVGAST